MDVQGRTMGGACSFLFLPLLVLFTEGSTGNTRSIPLEEDLGFRRQDLRKVIADRHGVKDWH